MKQLFTDDGFVVLLDDDDFAIYNKHTWSTLEQRMTRYAYRYDKDKHQIVWLHRELLDYPPMVDHKDGNGLNNQRNNLREATSAQNARNRRKSLKLRSTSRYKGVHYDTTNARNKRWRAAIRVNNKIIYLGRYVTEEEAAHAYDIAALAHFGEFARLNFPSIKEVAA